MADMTFVLSDEQKALKAAVYDLCKQYPAEYWRDLDSRREYPEKFVNELTQAGYLGALIPQEYGGSGLGIADGCLILETIHAHGGNAAACHAQMYIMGTVLRHGSPAQKSMYLPRIAAAIARNGPFAVRQAKKAIAYGAETDLDTAMILAIEAYNATVVTEDRLEGVRAFNEKRQPQFKGK